MPRRVRVRPLSEPSPSIETARSEQELPPLERSQLEGIHKLKEKLRLEVSLHPALDLADNSYIDISMFGQLELRPAEILA